MGIDENKTRISVVIEKELKKKLVKKAKADKRSLSSYIAIILENHVKK